ncbi:MAG TPA: hypothetical protein VIW01_03445 [Dehalococcoidia bacterium]
MLDVNITADASWADAAMVAITILIFAAAVAAAYQVNRQLRQSDRHHREQLHASLRPVLTIFNVECRLSGSPPVAEFMVWIENVGSGPALNATISAWVRTPQTPWTDLRGRMAEIESLKKAADIDDPDLTVRPAALPGRSDARPFQLIPRRDIVPVDYAGSGAILLYIANYKDVFGLDRPPGDKKDWELGHVQITLPGTTEALLSKK